MKKNNILFKQMELQKKIVSDVIFCEQTIETIAQHFSLPDDYTISKTRKREHVFGRQIAMYLIYKNTNLSLLKIGLIFNGKDHATVLHAKRTILNLMDSSRKTKNEINELEKFILYKIKVLLHKKTTAKDFYYINFDNYTSVRYSDNKGIIITGFSDEEVKSIIEFIKIDSLQLKKYENTGYYILEKNEDDVNT